MDYFLFKQAGQFMLDGKEVSGTEEATLCKANDITQVRGMDYIAHGGLVSDRLKLLLESFLPKNIWRPYIFMDMAKGEQEAFWYLELETYVPGQLELNATGYPCKMQVDIETVPRIFKIAAKNGATFIIAHLSVAESMMRRGIVGLELVPVPMDIQKNSN